MEIQPLKGFRDYGPEEMMVRERMIAKVRTVFESFGYMPIHTPALEYAEILLGKYGEEGEKLLYKFQDAGGRMVALRYDLTVPLARFVASHPELKFPFRRYHIAPVWRAEKPQKGRFREFYQCDVDLVGVDSPQADAECLLVDVGVLRGLGLKTFHIYVNHRQFLDGLLESLGIEGKAAIGTLRILDKVDKVTADEMRSMLLASGLGAEHVDRLVALAKVTGTMEERLNRTLELANNHPKAEAGLSRLRQVMALVYEADPEAPVVFSPATARGLDYYTGIVYETFLPAEYGVGSVMSGGRYDGLLGMFSGGNIPAVGISLGIDRLVAALGAKGETEEVSSAHALVMTMPGGAGRTMRAATLLRQAGLTAEVYPEESRLKKQFEYADRKGIPVAVVPGEDEWNSGAVTLKDLRSGTQTQVPLDQLAAEVRKLVV